MIKRLLSNTEYTIINPTTIEIDVNIKFEAKNLNLIISTSSNKILYNFACDDKTANVNGQIITLLNEEIDTTEDLLTIIMSFEEGSEIAKLNENILWNKRIQHILLHMLDEQMITNKYLQKIYNPE
jgi:hypothetical protein